MGVWMNFCAIEISGAILKTKVTRHLKQEPPSPTAQLKMFVVARPKQSLCTIFKRKYNLLDLFKCIKIFWAFIFDVMWQ